MPAYSFKERFIPMLKDGSKTQTIRGKRKGQAKPGDTVYLYYGMRTKHCMKIGEGICTEVNEVSIGKNGTVNYHGKHVPGLLLTAPNKKILRKMLIGKEADVFAWEDGFRPEGSTEANPTGAFELMIRFWKQTNGLPFFGDLIKWELKK